METPTANAPRPATLSEIRQLVGDLDAAKLEAILATGASVAEIEQAIIWAAGETDVMGDLQRPLEGRVAAVCDVLATEAPEADDDL